MYIVVLLLLSLFIGERTGASCCAGGVWSGGVERGGRSGGECGAGEGAYYYYYYY